MSCCGVSSEAISSDSGWSDNGQISNGGGYKNGCISETVSLIGLKLGQNVDESVSYHQVELFLC